MSIDFLAKLIGKARRRELEGRVALNLASLGKRLAVGAASASIAAAAKPDLLGTKTGILSLVGIGLVAMIPAGAASTGLVNPAQPGNPSVAEALVQSAVTLITAPSDKRQAVATAAEAKLQASIQAGLVAAAPALLDQAVRKLNQTNMAGFSTSELGQQDGNPSAPDAAIQQTGGNQ